MADKKIDTIVRYSPLDIPKIIRAHWNGQPKEPVHFVGEPSTVKSEGVHQESLRLADGNKRQFLEWNRVSLEDKQKALQLPKDYFVFADLRASETDIGELRLQDIGNGHGYITFKYNILFEALSKPDAMGILFFDEMNLAPNMIKAQFYKIINDHCVGDIPLSKDVMCISAGNEAEHSRGITEDPIPLVLRRGNYFLRPLSNDEYSDYAIRTSQHQWIVGYLNFQPQHVHKIDYMLPDSVGQPCPRTWTKLSNILLHNKMDIDDIERVATGFVGQGVGRQFTAYVKSAKQIDLNKILDNPELIKEYESDEQGQSLIYAIIAGIIDKFRTESKVFVPALKISLHMKRPEYGGFLLKGMKEADAKKMDKEYLGLNSSIVIDYDGKKMELMKALVARYAKFIYK